MFRTIVLILAFVAGLGMATVVVQSANHMEQLSGQCMPNIADLQLHP